MIPKQLQEAITLWQREARFGNIQINFVGGKIVNWNEVRSFKIVYDIVNATNVNTNGKSPTE